jgi:hypothetical protein
MARLLAENEPLFTMKGPLCFASLGVHALTCLNKLTAFFLVCAIFSLMEPGSALAYVPSGSAWPTDVSPCPGGNCYGQSVTIHYSYANMFDGGIKMPDGNPLPNPLIKSSIEKAFGFWAGVANLNFVEVPDNGPTAPQLRFRHIPINGPDPPPPADPIAKAQATCLGYGFGCEVQYDDTDRWQEAGTIPQPDILGASIHEIGHILGLNHTDVTGQNMYWIFHRYSGLNSSELSPANIPVQFYDDVAGIRWLYGAGTGSVTPLNAPEPATWLPLAIFIGLFLACGQRIRRRVPVCATVAARRN